MKRSKPLARLAGALPIVGAALIAAAPAAQAVPDNGWTQATNDDYCQSGESATCNGEHPDCRSSQYVRHACGGFRDYNTTTRPYPFILLKYSPEAVGSGFDLASYNAVGNFVMNGGSGGILTTNSPRVTTDTNAATYGVVQVQMVSQALTRCATTTLYATGTSPLPTHGNSRDFSIAQSNMTWNPDVAYDGAGGPGHCNSKPNVASHEWGHAIGFGHTKNSAQVMYATAPDSGAHSGDKAAVACVYQNQSSTGFPCS